MQIGKQLIATESLIRFVYDKSRQSIQLICQLSAAEQNSRRQACCLAFFGSSVYTVNKSIRQECWPAGTPTLVKQKTDRMHNYRKLYSEKQRVMCPICRKHNSILPIFSWSMHWFERSTEWNDDGLSHLDERDGKSNTHRRATRLASVEKRSARIMSFRRIIMRERSRRARQSVSFTCRGRFNYPIASSLPHHHSVPLSTPRFLFRTIESHRNSQRARVRAGGIQIARYRPDNPVKTIAGAG